MEPTNVGPDTIFFLYRIRFFRPAGMEPGFEICTGTMATVSLLNDDGVAIHNLKTEELWRWNVDVDFPVGHFKARDLHTAVPKLIAEFKTAEEERAREASRRFAERDVETSAAITVCRNAITEQPFSYTFYLNEQTDSEGRHEGWFRGYKPGDRLEAVHKGTACALSYEAVLDELWEVFNIDHPADYKNRSMSVGDVVVIGRAGESDRIYSVASVGWNQEDASVTRIWNAGNKIGFDPLSVRR